MLQFKRILTNKGTSGQLRIFDEPHSNACIILDLHESDYVAIE